MAGKDSSAASDFENGIARRHVQPPYEIERVGFEEGGVQSDRNSVGSSREMQRVLLSLYLRSDALDCEIPVIKQGRDRPAEHLILDANVDIFTDNNADRRR